MYFLDILVHQEPIRRAAFLKQQQLQEVFIVFGWLKFLGLFNTRMLPELAPWNFILGRITIVSAYVLEGNKERM
jgi:hypothetical protein